MVKEVIQLISGPRNISTALMYAFGNRKDTSVIDEPFYAHYLITHPEVDHPGRALTIASQENEFLKVAESILSKDFLTRYLFVKNMAHHMDGCDWSLLQHTKNIFLVRQPRQLIASFAQVVPQPTLLDIGIQLEYEMYNYACANGAGAVVIDSGELLKQPEKLLRMVCQHIDIPFDKGMLQWEAGPRKEDGVWAKYWYANVHKSTSFRRQKTSAWEFPERLLPLLDEANKYYDLLCAHSLKV
jgi:hypothetical protein